jgi:hypothetical protein
MAELDQFLHLTVVERPMLTAIAGDVPFDWLASGRHRRGPLKAKKVGS